jgi:3-oxoacyl-[acyl-carrier-protein] synthase-1
MLPFAIRVKPLRDYQHVLINHCGFGGNNAAIVLETQQQ